MRVCGVGGGVLWACHLVPRTPARQPQGREAAWIWYRVRRVNHRELPFVALFMCSHSCMAGSIVLSKVSKSYLDHFYHADLLVESVGVLKSVHYTHDSIHS